MSIAYGVPGEPLPWIKIQGREILYDLKSARVAIFDGRKYVRFARPGPKNRARSVWVKLDSLASQADIIDKFGEEFARELFEFILT